MSKLDQPHQNKICSTAVASGTKFSQKRYNFVGDSISEGDQIACILRPERLMMQFRRLQKMRIQWMLSAKKSIYKVDVVFFWNRPKYNQLSWSIQCNKLRSNACIIGCIKLKILISYLKVWESACPLFARKKNTCFEMHKHIQGSQSNRCFLDQICYYYCEFYNTLL